jgi:hypothetical protein
MKSNPRLLSLVMTILILASMISVHGQYQDYNQISQKINALEREYPALCKVRSLLRTDGGSEIFLISIGTGDKDSKPGIALIGGVDGKFILGRELAVGIASKILQNSSGEEIKGILDKITFYIIPDVNPDASAQFFSGLKFERNLNSSSTDDDRDFLNDEDPYEDLNKDGLITLIRIKDPAGNYIESEEDNRIMATADLSKGQTGTYLVYSEGTDNDKDGRFNEDGPGGVNFNNNLTYDYEEFGLNSGPYPVSEPETKAVADFLFDRFNIYTVFTFGPQDNLGQPMKASEKSAASSPSSQFQGPGQGMMRRERGRITSIMKSDEIINMLVSDKYHDITGAKGVPVSDEDPGNFMEWAYFHYGRYSFSTPGWWFPVEKGKNPEVAFLKFAEKNKLKDIFIPWTPISHPDFTGKTVETGGIVPFALNNPPQDTIGDLVSSHYKFITVIAAMHPELEFLDIKTEDKGENIYRLSLKVHNNGVFATNTEIGEQNLWTRIMRLTIEPSVGQTVLSGLKVQKVNRLQGDESAEFSWLISGKGSVGISAGSANVGQVNTSVALK